ncbi:MAG: RNA-binding domain-containing protein [Nanobdellota archaeon]
MKRLHFAKIRIIEREEPVDEAMRLLLGFDPNEEKDIEYNIKEGEDLNVHEIFFNKTRLTNKFIKNLKSKLDKKQRDYLSENAEEIVHHENRMFLRFDKASLMNREFRITDEGECFHLRLSIAAYPRKKEKAVKLIREIFK